MVLSWQQDTSQSRAKPMRFKRVKRREDLNNVQMLGNGLVANQYGGTHIYGWLSSTRVNNKQAAQRENASTMIIYNYLLIYKHLNNYNTMH
jgi:hypothetical protein